jgi:hypothetical protein
MPDHQQQQDLQTMGWLPIFLLSLAVASAGWVLGLRSLFSAWHGFPNTASTTFLFLAGVAVTDIGALGATNGAWLLVWASQWWELRLNSYG